MPRKKQIDDTVEALVPKSKKNKVSKRDKKKKEPVLNHTNHPKEITLEQWQRALRRQFVKDNNFDIKNVGSEVVYSDYEVHNPDTKKSYQVALRSPEPGQNYCACLDFKVNRLGTCKHIEAVIWDVAKRRKKKYLKVIPIRRHTSIFVDYSEGRSIKIRVGSESEAEFQRIADRFFDQNCELTKHGLAHFDEMLQSAKAISDTFRCYDDALDLVLDERENVRRKTKIDSLTEGDQKEVLLKSLVKATLFPYQKEGILFAAKNGRSIIADEMGLGKTIQAIGTAELLRKHFNVSKVLVLCPVSLKYQWKTELAKFTDNEATVIEGGHLARVQTYQNDESCYKIASYHSVLSDWEVLNTYQPDIIILDEAQRIKNWRTKIAQAVRRVSSRYMIVLTGTPIENNLDELYGLVQFVDPFILGPRHDFFPRYQVTDPDSGRVIGYQNLNEIRENLSEHLIRRAKKDVLKQLPKRTDQNLIVPITQAQRDVHREYADQVAKIVAKWHKFHFLDEKDRNNLLKFLNLMRMVCDSTYIIDQTTNYQTKLDELENILDGVLELEGEKIVIFSQWERMTRLVATMLDEAGVGYRHLHGGIEASKRGALYTDFNNDPEVRVFLSTDAGGVGLNLQAAAWLVNLDLPWNPGVLEQRIGRIYRLGQEKPVQIINIVAQGTIEHNLLGVIAFKKSMAAGVLDGGDDAIFMGDSKFKKFMESVEELTQQPTEKGHTVDAAEREEPAHATDTNEPYPEAANTTLEDIEVYKEEEEVVETPQVAPKTGRATNPQPALSVSEVGTPQTNVNNSPAATPQNAPARQASGSSSGTGQHLMPATPQALVQNGLQFLGQLAQTLADPQATATLVQSIVQKDETTGQSYLKLPVDDEASVANALNLLGGLFRAFGGK